MSTPLPISPISSSVSPGQRRAERPSWPAWMREPLLHFVLLGAVLFGIDHAIDSRKEDPHRIVIGAQVDRQAIELFKASRGRAPDAKELAALRRVWLDNEVLYREGLALQVDKGDDAIRERVIFKALSVVDAGTRLPQYDDTTLRAWFEAHRDKYDEPARFTFDEAVLAGESSEPAVRTFVERLEREPAGDAGAGLRLFKGRPHENLVRSYGASFAEALESASPGRWMAVRGRDGWRAVRLQSITPKQPARYEALRGVVLQDWTDATLAAQRSAAVEAMTKKYEVVVNTPS